MGILRSCFVRHLVDRLILGPFGMLLLQTALIWLGTFLIVRNWFLNSRFEFLTLVATLIQVDSCHEQSISQPN